MKTNLLYFLAVLLCFGGCRTAIDEPLTSLPTNKELIIEKLEELKDDEKYPELIEYISYLSRNDIAVADKTLTFYNRAGTEYIRKAYYESLEKENYSKAITYLQSLVLLDEIPEDSLTIDKLYVRQAKKYLAEEKTPAAIAVLQKMDNLSGISSEDLKLFGRKAVELSHVTFLKELVSELKKRNIGTPDALSTALTIEYTPDQYIAGTCTIWVNRGIKVERGIGFPDRVIGSGFFIDPNGYILTNYHIIASEVDPGYEGYSRLYIRLPGKYEEKIPAKVVGYDKIFDVALLKVPVEPEFIFSLPDIKQFKPGKDILAIGSPAGLDMTITSGIISAVGRRFLQIGNALQVDVPVNPGSSGGPLITREGLLIGIIFAGLPQFQGINFAIPLHWINKFIPDLFENGEVSHPWLGTALYEDDSRLEVIYVQRNTPSERAGLRPGDTIIAINDQEVSTIVDAQEIIMDETIDSLIKIRWQRDENSYEGFFTLDERPYLPLENALEKELITRLFPPLFGFTAEKIGGFLKKNEYKVESVLQGSIADETGLSPGDPFVLRGWSVDEELGIVTIRIFIRKKKAGFMQSGIQLTAFLETNIFI